MRFTKYFYLALVPVFIVIVLLYRVSTKTSNDLNDKHSRQPQSIENQNNVEKNYIITNRIDKSRAKVTEFTDKTGNTFGVCWSDKRVTKDLTSILGAKFSSRYAEKMKSAPRIKGRRFLVVANNDLVIKMSGAGRSFKSCVYDPGQLPEGTSENEIH